MINNKIIIFDFGSQTTHLIGRRIRELGVSIKIVSPDFPIGELIKEQPAGIIFSGGPASVYDRESLLVDKKIFSLGIPILGICYGQQLIGYLLSGQVKKGLKKEFGPAKIEIITSSSLFETLSKNFTVWMSHGDEVVKLPSGFKSLAKTKTIDNAVIADEKNKIYGLQFHPEVNHTEFGQQIFKNFLEKICGFKTKRIKISISEIINQIKKEVGKDKVICAVSGGVDSTVAAVLIGKAIGENLIPVYVESGLMRLGTKEEVIKNFKTLFKIKPIIIEAKEIFLKKLRGVIDPEKKRKIIGHLYIELFEKEAGKINGVKFLGQGTIYSDVIESKGTKNADKIKSHHNVGGLPKNLKLKLIEPLRFFYKDEVREIGRKLGLPEEIINKQVFPGPGQAIRIIGEVTKERLERQQRADSIVLEEIKKAGLYHKVFMSFSVLTDTKSTAVKGDARAYLEVAAVRIIESSDVMTADWAKLPYGLLGQISSRIVNEVSGVSRVVYDISTKPPATMEWE